MMKIYVFLTEMIYMLELAVLPVTTIALSIIFADDHRKYRENAERGYFLLS